MPGNAVRILRNAEEHFPVWLAAIGTARRTIMLENYIFAYDEVGQEFVAALAARARDGVHVRVLYDWLGNPGSRQRLWRPLQDAGGEVRCFNPPRLDSPFGWIVRDHRKLLTVDGRIGFVTGLCVSAKWAGDPARGVDPWRDTGIEIRGPAVADLERAFAETWSEAGPALPVDAFSDAVSMTEAGDVAMRVLATKPNVAGLYRLDQLVAAMARQRLWLTDAYFVGVAPYVQSLIAAARDGVDVRLLVPGASDIPALRPLTRIGYRPLLESGIRVFEWNGAMLHAKTAVADGKWARVGSTNLNVSSWLGNYELDVAVEDPRFAAAMEDMYREDLANATEIVLDDRCRVCAASRELAQGRKRGTGSAARAAAGALRLGNTVSAAITGQRRLGATEAGITAGAAALLLLLSIIIILWPALFALPIGVLAGWCGIALFAKAKHLRRGSNLPPAARL